MGAKRTLKNGMFAFAELHTTVPRRAMRRALGAVNRRKAGLTDFLSLSKYRNDPTEPHFAYSTSMRDVAEAGVPYYEHRYHPTKGWRTSRATV